MNNINHNIIDIKDLFIMIFNGVISSKTNFYITDYYTKKYPPRFQMENQILLIIDNVFDHIRFESRRLFI